MHDRGKPSRAKQDERYKSPFAIQTFEAKAPATRCSRRRTGIHDLAVKKQALETTPSTRATRGGEGSEWCWETTRPRAAREESVRKRTRGSARGRANSSSNHRKPLTNQGTTLRRQCWYGARGARLTHSQAATPGSEHSSSQQTG